MATEFIAGGIERVARLSRARFEREFRFRRPIIVTNGARRMPAMRRWSLSYLLHEAGSATVHVADYRSDAKDYDKVVRAPVTFERYLRDLMEGTGHTYLFNNTSCVFARNEQRPDLHVGWASAVNPGLAPLARDLRLPPFVPAEDYVIAALILGSERNGTDLHYDNGGEAKLLVQLRGRKKVLLVPPSAAALVGMRSPFQRDPPDGKRPNPSRTHTRLEGVTGEQAAALQEAGVLCAVLEPGDVLYWPAFWLHDVTNVDGPNLAIGIFVDEVHLSPLLMRHLMLKTFRDFDAMLRTDPTLSLHDLFERYERFLVSDCQYLNNLWQWNDARPQVAAPAAAARVAGGAR